MESNVMNGLGNGFTFKQSNTEATSESISVNSCCKISDDAYSIRCLWEMNTSLEWCEE